MGIFSSSGSSQCPDKPTSDKGESIVGSLTFQHFITIVGWACFGITFILWLGLVLTHLRRYNAPKEQRQIFRIVTTPLVFALVAVISTHTYPAAKYLEPLSSLYETFALASLFLLYVQYVCPDPATRDCFFRNVELKGKHASTAGSVRWFWNTWRIVFFYVVAYAILVVVQEITQATGTYCATSSKPRFAHIWIQSLELITTIVAIVAVIRFQRRLKSYMTGKKALPKLVIFKLFVAVTTLQNFVFSFLKSKVKGGSKVTYDDITIGIPALLVCVEAVLFTVGYHFIFSAKEYRDHKTEAGRGYSMGQALLDALNPIDLIQGIGQAFRSFGKH